MPSKPSGSIGTGESYPESGSGRTRWIVSRRPARPAHDPWQPQGHLVETECDVSGAKVPVLTVFLTSRECPWHCLMCDLWKFAIEKAVPPGAIPTQLDRVLARADEVREARQVKLYNAGSFFDPGAVPPADYTEISRRLARFDRVIVECHPALVGPRCVEFRDQLTSAGSPTDSGPTTLEVAMGLETVHPEALEKLNKRMTLGSFRRAARFLLDHAIDVRAFVLVQAPFLDPCLTLEWTRKSVEFSFDCGATAVSLVPTRFGNGALEALTRRQEFVPPRLDTVEEALASGIQLKRGRVFADLWDLEQFSVCPACFAGRKTRLREMNLRQVVLPRVDCDQCPEPG